MSVSRVAVALPTLAAGSPHRDALDATFAALGATGVDVEGFAESGRIDGSDPFPVVHYLRFAERHQASPFDAAVYPLGRDAPPYEPVVTLMHRFPGYVWLLDPVLHHLLVGGMAMRGQWSAYGAAQDRSFGDRGPQMLEAVASGWGSRAFYRRFDPAFRWLAAARGVGAVSGRIRRDWARHGFDVDELPLPIADPGASAEARERDPSHRIRRILVASMNLSSPGPTLAGIAAFLEARPGVEVRVALPEVVYHVTVGPQAGRVGVGETIEWVLSPDWPDLGRLVDRADVVLLLRDDVTCGDRALAHRALASGKIVVALRGADAEDFPEGVVARVEPGRGLGRHLAGVLSAVTDDAELSAAMRAAAAEHAAGRPGPEDVARRLLEQLKRQEPGELVDVTGRTWGGLWQGVRTACTPPAGAPETRALIDEALAAAVPDFVRVER